MLHRLGGRLVLGREAVGEKANEIVAIPLLLERLHLAGALVTIDAMGTQTAIAQTILNKEPTTFCTQGQLACPRRRRPSVLRRSRPSRAGQVRGDRRRPRTIETRRHMVCHNIDWLLSDRRYPREQCFPGLKAIAMVESDVERGGRTSWERRCYLSSLPLDAKLFARVVRADWGIENRLHWVLDVVFHDDLMRLRTENGPKNIAAIKHMAMNLLRRATDKDSLTTRRKAAAWNPDYLKAIVMQTA